MKYVFIFLFFILHIKMHAQDHNLETPMKIFSDAIKNLYMSVEAERSNFRQLDSFNSINAYYDQHSFYFAQGVKIEDEHDENLLFEENGCYLRFEIFYPVGEDFKHTGGELKKLGTSEYYFIKTVISTGENHDIEFEKTIDSIFNKAIKSIERNVAQLPQSDFREPDDEMDMLEQKVIGINPDGSIYDASGTYYTDALEDFKLCLGEQLQSMLIDAFIKNTEPSMDSIFCYEKFNAMVKGTTNLLESDFVEFISKREDMYKALYSEIQALKAKFENEGLKVKIEAPGSYKSWPYWDMGIEPGLNLLINGDTYLYISIPVNATTSYYNTLNQGPLAADVIAITEKYMILFPANQKGGENFFRVIKNMYNSPQNITDQVEEARQAYLVEKSHLFIETGIHYTLDGKKELIKKFKVRAIFIGNASDFTGEIFINEDTDGVMRELNR
ncbi:MAG: hypothetical protein JXB49_12745 [Bacteroidales bacterium]|nr:hypothetical protein [Bacteroidales bacterium]